MADMAGGFFLLVGEIILQVKVLLTLRSAIKDLGDDHWFFSISFLIIFLINTFLIVDIIKEIVS